ncbi:hypothetical protein [Pectobacterium versatile]|uniref:hypothetical protein n=1 Tax=Pectobacterium versatile TaxID=2488639 RepID=UPI001CCEE33A|nr:hypothetical protein [Pectobacterium versatile]
MINDKKGQKENSMGKKHRKIWAKNAPPWCTGGIFSAVRGKTRITMLADGATP